VSGVHATAHRLLVTSAIAFALVASMAGCAAGAEREHDRAVERAARSVDVLDVDGQRAVVARAPDPNGAAVLVVHGYQGDAWTPFAFDTMVPVTTALLRRGYAVAASDAHGNSWGSDASVRDYRALAAELADQRLEPRYVIGMSMGGLSALRLIAHLPVRAWVGIYPVCSLRSIVRRGGYDESIADAHGGEVRRAVARLSPALPRRGLRGLPMRFYASEADTVVPKGVNADRCAALARRRGARARVVQARGDHGHPSHFRPRQVVRLFERVRTR
jgi:pimeloyl-ACP methyl ester carboxylesterase